MAELRFDEFRAVQQRQRTKESDRSNFDDAGGSKKRKTPDQQLSTVTTATVERQELLFKRAGGFIELPETQLVVSALILGDVLASAIDLVLTCRAAALPDQEAAAPAVLRLLRSFTDFTVFLFLLELLLMVVAFGSTVFFHPGYLLDSAVVGACLYSDIVLDAPSKDVRLLGILRLWRLVRLHGTLIAGVRSELEEAKTETLVDKERAARLEVEVARLEDSIRTDALARKRVEQMCRAYKDEVDTLNEALKIAARDIAEAAGSELESEEEAEAQADATEKPAKPRVSKFVVDAAGSFNEVTS